MTHEGGFTCAEVDAGSQHMAAAVTRLRDERNAALRAYDAEVIAHRDETTRLLAELRGEREKYRQVVEINHANQRSYWAELDALRIEGAASPEAESRASRSMMLLEACDAIPDITISKWACDPGGPWNRVREVLRARRAAQGLDVDAADPETAFDERGWLKGRDLREISAADEWVCVTCHERNVTRSDEDLCCIQCGMDLTERGELLRFLLAPAPALKPLALTEDRTPEQLAADGDLEPGGR